MASLSWGIPALDQVLHAASRTFDPDECSHLHPGFLDFRMEFLGLMEVGGREPVRDIFGIAVLTLGEIPFDDFAELGVEEASPGQAVT